MVAAHTVGPGAAAPEDAVTINYGNEMLKLLAISDGQRWGQTYAGCRLGEGSKTQMEPGGIQQLIRDVAARELNDEQRSAVESYIDDPLVTGDTGPTQEERID